MIISPEESHRLVTEGPEVYFVDVRTPAEYAALHAAHARNIPLDQLESSTEISSCSRSAPILLICQSGARSRKAAEVLFRLGFTNVTEVSGGTAAWIAAKLPVVSGSGVISLERQVRIAAGSLVCMGVLLGQFAHPAGYLLSAFVGAGLVFAGVTDTCGMALFLARMPWNSCGKSCLQSGGGRPS